LDSPSVAQPHPSFSENRKSQIKNLKWAARRLVLKHVTRLHHLKENHVLSNEQDLALVLNFDGELVSPLELIPAPDVQPDQALIDKESLIEFHYLKSQFQTFLAKERRLIRLFNLRCKGITRPKLLACRFKLSIRTIESLQKRLQRKWLAFSGPPQNQPPNIKIISE
jgi:hypothetical protein